MRIPKLTLTKTERIPESINKFFEREKLKFQMLSRSCCSGSRINKEITEPSELCRNSTFNSQNSTNLRIEVRFSENFKIIFSESSSTFITTSHTTTYLISKTLELCKKEYELATDKKNTSALRSMPSEKMIDAIIGLQTNDSKIHLDYLLSLPDYPLTFLPQSIVLVPYYSVPLRAPHSGITLEDFEIIAKLGRGGSSKVYLVRLKSTGVFYALKQMNKSRASDEERERMLRERNIMRDLENPLLLKLHYAFQTSRFCYLVCEFAPGGDLRNFVRQSSTLSEEKAKYYIAELLLALQALHSDCIIYRDLKLDNVLVTIDGHIKLADFGFARRIEDKQKFVGTICGTLSTSSPEIVRAQKYDFRVDYYSLGALIYEFLTGKPLYEEKDAEEIMLKIVYGTPDFPKDMSKELKNLISRLLCKNPDQRLGSKKGLEEIFQHKWFKGIDFQAIKKGKIKPPIQNPRLITQKLTKFDELASIEDDRDYRSYLLKYSDYERLDRFSYGVLDSRKIGSLELVVSNWKSNRRASSLNEVPRRTGFDENYTQDLDEIDSDHEELAETLSRCSLFSSAPKFSRDKLNATTVSRFDDWQLRLS